jgi:hypothetical protein
LKFSMSSLLTKQPRCKRSTSTTKSVGVLTITTHRRQRGLLAYMGDVQGHLEAGSLKYLARRMHL